MEVKDLMSGFEPEDKIPEKNKKSGNLVRYKSDCKKRRYYVKQSTIQMYDKADLKYVESKLRKAINEKKKRFCVDKLIVFTTLADRIVQAVIDMLQNMENE